MILYLISELDIGGAEKSLFNLVKRLDWERFGKPAVACLWGKGLVGEWLAETGVEVTHLNLHKIGLLLAGLRLRSILKTGRFRLLHTFMFHANFVGRLAAIGTGVPVISSIRVMEVDRPFRATLDRLTSRFVVAETCVSDAVRRWSIEHGLPGDKLVTISNGVDCSGYNEAPGKIRSELQLPGDAKIALFVGRLDRQKGPDILLAAAVELCPQMPELHFVLAGDGPLKAALDFSARKSNIDTHFHLLGHRDDVPQLLADADVFVLPSRWEGMPNAVLEAMAAARPVVAADVGGCGELVEDGRTGLLVPPGDVAGLARAIREIAAAPDLAARMGEGGRRRACDEFPVERMVRLNEELYERVLHAEA